MTLRRGALAVLVLVGSLAGTGCTASSQEQTAPVTLRGGTDLRPDDYGRPVPLYASMLGVTPDVFRQAFSGVHPDADHAPTPEQEEANKAALLRVLGPFGVSNDQLDQVANHYRFNGTQGETWPRKPASAHAVLRDGVVVSIVVDDAGAGYPYPPTATVDGHPEATVAVTVVFTRDFATNGSLSLALS